jgi:cytidine deaminase
LRSRARWQNDMELQKRVISEDSAALAADDQDQELLDAAIQALERVYAPERHTVGCALRTVSGKIYVGVNIKACGYGPCAETIAIGNAFTVGDHQLSAIVAVKRSDDGKGYKIVSPCGNCRQLIVDYAPDTAIIYADGTEVRKARAVTLLPGHFQTRLTERALLHLNGNGKSNGHAVPKPGERKS